MSFGKIDQASLRWIPVPKFNILDKGVVDGVDYHTMSFERREFDFDDLVVPSDHIVVSCDTGRMFMKYDYFEEKIKF